MNISGKVNHTRKYSFNKGKRFLVAWIQLKCQKCQKFLGKYQQKYCFKCAKKIRKEQIRINRMKYYYRDKEVKLCTIKKK